MDISSTPMSHASWRVDELPSDAPKGSDPRHPEVLTVPPGSSSLSLSSLSKSKSKGGYQTVGRRPSSSSSAQAMSTSEPVGASLASLALAASLSPRSESPLFGNGGDRAIPREVRRGDVSYVITEHGEFPIDDEILTWSRELGFMSWIHRAPGRPISDDERKARKDLK